MIHKSIEIVVLTTAVLWIPIKLFNVYENGSSSNRATFSQIAQLGMLKIASESDRDENK